MPLGYRYAFDPTYILVVIGALVSIVASMRVKSTFHKYSGVRSRSNMTGAQAAQRVLNSAGIFDVRIQHVAGSLTDHYNPKNKTLNLSDDVYGSSSVAAVGVAAHECGHAIQHQKGYSPLQIRSALVPVANFGSAAPEARCAKSALCFFRQPYCSSSLRFRWSLTLPAVRCAFWAIPAF